MSKPDWHVERIIYGQKRVFQHPKQAELTEKGEEYVEDMHSEDIGEYENLTHSELVKKVYDLEARSMN